MMLRVLSCLASERQLRNKAQRNGVCKSSTYKLILKDLLIIFNCISLHTEFVIFITYNISSVITANINYINNYNSLSMSRVVDDIVILSDVIPPNISISTEVEVLDSIVAL